MLYVITHLSERVVSSNHYLIYDTRDGSIEGHVGDDISRLGAKSPSIFVNVSFERYRYGILQKKPLSTGIYPIFGTKGVFICSEGMYILLFANGKLYQTNLDNKYVCTPLAKDIQGYHTYDEVLCKQYIRLYSIGMTQLSGLKRAVLTNQLDTYIQDMRKKRLY